MEHDEINHSIKAFHHRSTEKGAQKKGSSRLLAFLFRPSRAIGDKMREAKVLSRVVAERRETEAVGTFHKCDY